MPNPSPYVRKNTKLAPDVLASAPCSSRCSLARASLDRATRNSRTLPRYHISLHITGSNSMRVPTDSTAASNCASVRKPTDISCHRRTKEISSDVEKLPDAQEKTSRSLSSAKAARRQDELDEAVLSRTLPMALKS